MRTVALQELSDLEDSYWWHVGRQHIIDSQLKIISRGSTDLNILNIGSGTGGTIPTLDKYGEVTNVDVSEEALQFLNQKGYKGTLVKGKTLPLKSDSVDVVAALDVLEHIEDDDKALKEWIRVIKPGGALLLTVPAYQWLWSQHDVINNHYRRYVLRKLKHQLTEAGFSVEKASYAIVFSFPLVVASRFVSKIRGEDVSEYSSFVKVPDPINNLFIRILRLEGHSHRYLNFPLGTSILCVCYKK